MQCIGLILFNRINPCPYKYISFSGQTTDSQRNTKVKKPMMRFVLSWVTFFRHCVLLTFLVSPIPVVFRVSLIVMKFISIKLSVSCNPLFLLETQLLYYLRKYGINLF